MEYHEVVMLGAQARGAGMPLLANPYLGIENYPAGTGMSIREWLDRALSWRIGWEMADSAPMMPPLLEI
jgi:hypothetical protein